ncbi:MAG: 1,4-dihydroxy-2-naphthoate polyprenyltransferase [Polyangiaceae bacterium]|nr:1,4-dihydroxy-2-naphthoate polyprenyltransferase [Polyangiaceae bacterium]
MNALPAPGSVGAWVLAARPATLPVAVAPVAVGSSIASASGSFNAAAGLAALGGALLIQIGTNLANDVFDAKKGADDERRIGPPRAVSQGLLSARAVWIGMIVSFILAMLTGIYLIAVGGMPILAIGILSIASGIAYTGGPYPLGYNGLGDVFVFVFFGGVAVVGTTFVTAGVIAPAAWIASVPVGALATCVLVVNNVRDHEGDVRAKKRTLVVRFGRRFGVMEYLVLVVASAAAIIALPALGWTPPLALVALLPLPFGFKLWTTLRDHTDGPTLNRCLASTAKLMLAVSVLLALGIGAGQALR